MWWTEDRYFLPWIFILSGAAGTCIVVAVIELYMYTYLFNFSGEDSVIDFDWCMVEDIYFCQ